MHRATIGIWLALAGLAGSWAATAEAKVRTETVEYRHGDTVLEGYLAWNDAKRGKRPAVMIVHEWTGVGPYVRQRAHQLAELGYVAFAADIYGKGIRPQGPKEAAAEATKYRSNRSLQRARVRAGLDWLKADKRVDAGRVAAIGYCFGGGTVLELARSGAELRGVVSFHGNLDTPYPADAKNIKAKVLALHGGDDPFVPKEQVLAFQQEMRAGGVDWQLVVYGGAVHSFTNPASGNDPKKGAAYDVAADRRSWAAMRAFLDEVLR
jgi:dienelactone hydrolase